MKLVLFISSLILTVSMTAFSSPNKTTLSSHETAQLESVLFHNPDLEPIAIEDIHVIELEDDIDLGFDISKYLPANFNPLKGKGDIDLSKIELVELEEAVDFNFNVQDYLPKNFNPYKGMATSKSCSK